VRVCVEDTGTGIPEAALDSIFERFAQAGPKARKGGLGLGLYISRCIIEAHGGRIWAESRPGAGAKILLSLPSRASSSAVWADEGKASYKKNP
jgi:signal transduction histidine kinase